MLALELTPVSAAGNTEMVRVLSNASAASRHSSRSTTFLEPREDELLDRATALEDELSFSGISLLEEYKREWWLFWQKRHLSSLMSSANVGVANNSYNSGLQ